MDMAARSAGVDQKTPLQIGSSSAPVRVLDRLADREGW